MRINWNYIKMIALLLVITGLYAFSNHRSEEKSVKGLNIEFVGNQNLYITQGMVNKLLIQNYGELKSQPKENIILRSLEQTLKSNDMIEDADVFLTVEGKLGASIKQRTPIARVNDEAVAYYIDAKGDRMPLSANYSARVPLLSGVKGNNFKNAYTIASLIFNDSFLQKQIIGIEQNSKKEFVLRTRIGNQQIELGSMDNVNAKFKKLKAFYNKVLKDKTIDKYQTINLIYSNQVVCTKK